MSDPGLQQLCFLVVGSLILTHSREMLFNSFQLLNLGSQLLYLGA